MGHGRYGHQAMEPACEGFLLEAMLRWVPVQDLEIEFYLAESGHDRSKPDNDGGTLKRE